jgi:peroxiredoxin
MILAGGAALAVVQWASATLKPPGPVIPAAPRSASLAGNHYVDLAQLADANGTPPGCLADLSFTTAQAQTLTWEQLSGGRPVVLVFVKHGCPCSVEFEPFFHRVWRRYDTAARFAEVIDAPPAAAQVYAANQKAPYPVLADPQRFLIDRIGAKNGGYFALLTPSGRTDTLWPGCSVQALAELGRRIAQLVGLSERTLDLSDLPGPWITGCPYTPPAGAVRRRGPGQQGEWTSWREE